MNEADALLKKARAAIRGCAVEGCHSPFHCKGYCIAHYERARKNNGDPGPAEIAAFTIGGHLMNHHVTNPCESCTPSIDASPHETGLLVIVTHQHNCDWLAVVGEGEEELPGVGTIVNQAARVTGRQTG